MPDLSPASLTRQGALGRFTTPLEALPESSGLLLAEITPPGQINLRGRAEDAAFLSAAGAVLDCRLPVGPNTVHTVGALRVLWLGPDEWLVLTAPGAEAELIGALRQALDGQHAAVVDVTGNRSLLRLAGPEARTVLAKGCSLDLHPSRFGPGQCAQTLIARCGVLLHQLDDRPSFDLLPRRSFSEYLWMWLSDAMAEFDGRAAA